MHRHEQPAQATLTLVPADGDAMGLVEAALSAHSQLTRDVGDSMAAAVLCRRQVWLAQTSLPEAIRTELLNLPVAPGHVFHPETQAVLDRTERNSGPAGLHGQLVTFGTGLFRRHTKAQPEILIPEGDGDRDRVGASTQAAAAVLPSEKPRCHAGSEEDRNREPNYFQHSPGTPGPHLATPKLTLDLWSTQSSMPVPPSPPNHKVAPVTFQKPCIKRHLEDIVSEVERFGSVPAAKSKRPRIYGLVHPDHASITRQPSE
ncbi:unnamed protein product [Arctogadus glacialis]